MDRKNKKELKKRIIAGGIALFLVGIMVLGLIAPFL